MLSLNDYFALNIHEVMDIVAMFLLWILWSKASLHVICEQERLLSDWSDAQANLNICCLHIHEGSPIASFRLKLNLDWSCLVRKGVVFMCHKRVFLNIKIVTALIMWMEEWKLETWCCLGNILLLSEYVSIQLFLILRRMRLTSLFQPFLQRETVSLRSWVFHVIKQTFADY